MNFTCFFDCCHSGTITRLVAPATVGAAGRDVRARGLRATPEHGGGAPPFRASRCGSARRAARSADMKEVSFTACTDAQTAQEMDGHGQFTVRALGMLRQGSGTMTNGEFHQRVVSAFGGDSSRCRRRSSTARRRRGRAAACSEAAAVAVAAAARARCRSMLARLDEIERRVSRLGL